MDFCLLAFFKLKKAPEQLENLIYNPFEGQEVSVFQWE